ncbi:hypothetical protein ADUPG1_009897 [Aduncisulcus paluster]|uniref:carnosine N-methyltransferase n=1 Tax=Aduncisulcus paluster TaxID=2918883 RepID=A0ABQ5KX56_9EUKA|nr:hypothetical protein ADUPG1_009897 [Aduncisulcus paluster]
MGDKKRSGKHHDDDEEEINHWQRVTASFKNFPFYQLKKLEEIEGQLKKGLESYPDILDEQLKFITARKDQLMEMIPFISLLVARSPFPPIGQPTDEDFGRVASVMRQFVREWSEEGKLERDMCFNPIFKALSKYCPSSSDSTVESPIVLVPGSGLGRLGYELSQLGYAVECNEVSVFMLLGSAVALNFFTSAEQFTVMPLICETINMVKDEDIVKKVKIPDILPGKSPKASSKSMPKFCLCAGEFLDCYACDCEEKEAEERAECCKDSKEECCTVTDDSVIKKKNPCSTCERYDVIVTCFFIDTAHNVTKYIERIAKLLKPGGIWINLGPLMYHWVGMGDQESLEISWSTIKSISEKNGFMLCEEELLRDIPYCSYHERLRENRFNCIFSVMRMPE